MLKTIIFDLDGVIIDSEPQHARAALHVFTQHEIPVDLEYCKSFIGSSTRNMAESTAAQFGLSVSADRLLEEINEAKRQLIVKEGYQLLPGVLELIRSLYRAGIRLAIASSSSPSEIENAVKALKIKKYFDKLISGSHVENPKPAPDIFLLALKEMGCSAKESIVIEDSRNGCLAAKAAGITCVGYVNPHSGEQELSSADVLLESFEGIDERFFHHILMRSLGMPVTIADTKRLLIRELTPDDIRAVYSIYMDPDVQKYIPDIDDYLTVEMEKQLAYIRNVYSFYGYGMWGVFSKTSKKLIGKCGLENLMIDGKEEIALSYLLDTKYWGYGYALECCRAVFDYAKEQLNISRIVAVIDRENARSLKTAKNLDMHPEKEITYKGRDCLVYVITI